MTLVVPVLTVLLLSSRADAYTWMIRHGYGGCTTCHVDPSGGELLTRYGRIQGDLLLRMRYGKDNVSAAASQGGKSADFDSFDSFDSTDTQGGGGGTAQPAKDTGAQPSTPAQPGGGTEPTNSDSMVEAGGASPSAGFLWGLWNPPDWLTLGGAYRHLTVWKPKADNFDTFPMQVDLYGAIQAGRFRAGGSIGVIKVAAGSEHGHATQITTAQGDTLNLASRTHWVGYDITPDVLLRAGRINLPFGVRIPEHTMWVRSATRTDRESDQQHGVSVAFQGSWFRGEAMGILGNYQINPDKYRERGYSLFAEALASDWAAFGVSSLVTRADADRILLDDKMMVRQAHGAFARIALFQKLALLLEADGLLRSRFKPGYVGMAQADYELVQGLHLMGTGEVLDQGKRDEPGADAVKGEGKPRFGGWLSADWFFLPHFEARVDAIARQQDPFTLLGQLHFYL